jgi:hypothetical protein
LRWGLIEKPQAGNFFRLLPQLGIVEFPHEVRTDTADTLLTVKSTTTKPANMQMYVPPTRFDSV